MKRPNKKPVRAKYEPEVSDRRSTGSVSVGNGAWWTADLIVSIRREDQILLMLRRHGMPEQEEPSESVEISLHPVDLDALPVLLTGVIAQARRDGVVPLRKQVSGRR